MIMIIMTMILLSLVFAMTSSLAMLAPMMLALLSTGGADSSGPWLLREQRILWDRALWAESFVVCWSLSFFLVLYRCRCHFYRRRFAAVVRRRVALQMVVGPQTMVLVRRLAAKILCRR